MKKWLFLSVVLLTSSGIMAAKSMRESTLPPCNEQIKAMLDQADIAYVVDDDGDFRLEEKIDETRTQLVWIRSKQEVFQGTQILEVFSFAYKGSISPELQTRLLKENGTKKFGSWALLGDDPQAMLITFYVHLTGEFNFKDLANAVILAAGTTDQLEKELTQKDDR